MKIIGPVFIIVFLIAAILVLNAAFVVSETQQVVLTQFGEPIGDPIKAPGLHFKIPFFQNANYFEKRILRWDGDANMIPTKDKKYIWVDSTARWRIVNPLVFLQKVYNYEGAQQRLDAILDGATRNVLADKNLIEIVRSSNRIVAVIESGEYDATTSTEAVEKIPENSGREEIRKEILERARPKVENFGIELVDFRIKRINYESDVRRDVFERMRSERKRVADKYRSEGDAERARIEGLRQKEQNRIKSEAYRKAEGIRGNADAEAIKIYADAYQKDEDFYAFLQTLSTYKKTLTKNTTLILSDKDEYLNYLKNIEGRT